MRCTILWMALGALLSTSLAGGANADDHWVGTWAAAQQLTERQNLPPSPGLSDTTLRQIVHVSLGGTRLRVRFSNAFGTAPLTLVSVHVAISAGGGAIMAGSDKALTFNRSASVTIRAGSDVASDPIDFRLTPLSDLAVSVYVRNPSTAVTGHPGSRTTSYLAPGNAVSAVSLSAPATVTHWYSLSGVDVVNGPRSAAVATLGDSITDGRGSTTDGNDRWPDALAQRLQANPQTAHIAVLNAGIGGNAVLHGGLGPTALTRLDRDVLEQPGVRWLIVLEGINDIGSQHPPTAQEMISAYEQIITRAHAHGIRVFGGTITPCGGSGYFSPEMEATRQAINNWVRTGGVSDGCVDFDMSVRDPQDPTRLRADADSGDHLHLSPAGYRLMAGAVDLGHLKSR